METDKLLPRPGQTSLKVQTSSPSRTGAKGELSRLQQAFIDYGAVQCGFCTPGMILSAKALLDKNPHPTEEEIRRAISGNLCRCTGYQAIVDAVQAVSSNIPHAQPQPLSPVQEKDRLQ